MLWQIGMLALACCLTATAQTRAEPRMFSLHPFSGQIGSTFLVTVRGSGLSGTIAAETAVAPFKVSVESVATEPAEVSGGRAKTAIELVTLRIVAEQGAVAGRYPIRLLTRGGLSNALPIHLVNQAVAAEPVGAHEAAETAIRVDRLPAVYAGHLARRGETDLYQFRAEAGQVLTFEAISGFPQAAAGGSAATVPNFDPALTIFETNASWFDAGRLERIAFNDEPLWLAGRPTDAHLVHRFARAGNYYLRVEAFAGQGGPDYSYQMKIADGALLEYLPPSEAEWDERTYSQRLDTGRLNQLARRGGTAESQKSIETYRGAAEPAAISLPATVEGALTKPGEIHRARFRVDSPADLAIEIETPSAAPPFFNPIVRLLNASGEEVATNVFVGKGACNGAMTKSLQVKTILPLRETGDFTLEIRDATSEQAAASFRYRLQVRPQIPHLGKIRLETDVVNLAPGESKMLKVVFDREENYRGAVAVAAESLPAGVTATVGADYEPDTDPPSTVGKRERYVPRTENAVLVLSANADAVAWQRPQEIQVVVRPLVGGKLGERAFTKTIPIMVVAKP